MPKSNPPAKKGASKRQKSGVGKPKKTDARATVPSRINPLAPSGSGAPIPSLSLPPTKVRKILSEIGVDDDDIGTKDARQFGTSGGQTFPGKAEVTLFQPKKATALAPKRALVHFPGAPSVTPGAVRDILLDTIREDGGELPNEFVFSFAKPADPGAVQDKLRDEMDEVLDVAFADGNFHRIGREMTLDRHDGRFAVQFNTSLVEPGLPTAAAVSSSAASAPSAPKKAKTSAPAAEKPFLDEDLPDDDEPDDDDFLPEDSDGDDDSSGSKSESDSEGSDDDAPLDEDDVAPQPLKRPRTALTKAVPKTAAPTAATSSASLPKSALPVVKKLPPLKTLEQFGTNKRKPGDEVTIEREEITVPLTGKVVPRTTKLSARVVYTPTKGRPSAPEPSGFRVSTSAASANQRFGIERNQGAVDVQKGHLMALELGGPDIEANINPQWANWQGNGLWRNMENEILALAQKPGRNVHMVVEPVYSGGTSFHALSFPVGFEVSVRVSNSKSDAALENRRYSFDQQRDATDDKLAERVFAKIDDDDAQQQKGKKRGRDDDA